ncbi:electron transfer flavoprotein subunit beta/FixA family protein [Arthrobacter sp.]|uniref:electron transfer flavoprotein subunit beta/FixA family protein n=1 Tax=Arthrobacter sp. TaxID=1667 RepID=UPI003397C48D
MKIVVLVKQVPDTYEDRKLDLSSGLLDRGASDIVPDEINERALESALRFKDGQKGTEIVVLTMGPDSAIKTLRKLLSMGADSAIHIVDDALAASDMVQTARMLAAAIQPGGFDLVIAGNESTDGRGGVVPAMVAEILGLPLLPSLDNVELAADSVSGTCSIDGGSLTVRAPLPAVVSVTERSAEARFPNFKGIMMAKRKPVETIDRASLATDVAAATSVVGAVTKRPARVAGTKIVDDGTAATELAGFLASNRLI